MVTFRSLVGGVAAAGLLVAVQSAAAGVFVETGDVGQMPAVATLLPGGTDKITGNLNFDADLYRFYWSGGNFHANTIDYSVAMTAQRDCELFLFDNAGNGLWANNDAWSGVGVPAGSAYVYANLAQGYYLLGVTIHNLEPVDDSFYYTIFPTFPYVSTPKEPDPTSGPLAGWGNDDLYSWASGNYVINFAQADLGTGAAGPSYPTSAIPEPTTLGFLVLGGLVWMRRRK
jgi:hypothetical protein